jgi:uncharacterized FlaG/YvyC family protein
MIQMFQEGQNTEKELTVEEKYEKLIEENNKLKEELKKTVLFLYSKQHERNVVNITINGLGEEDVSHVNEKFVQKLTGLVQHFFLRWDGLPYFIQSLLW